MTIAAPTFASAIKNTGSASIASPNPRVAAEAKAEVATATSNA